MSQNSKNSKRVTRKTNFNMKLETLTVQVDISQPLDSKERAVRILLECIIVKWEIVTRSDILQCGIITGLLLGNIITSSKDVLCQR